MSLKDRIKKRLRFILSSSYKLAKATTFEHYSFLFPKECKLTPLGGKRITKIVSKCYIDEPQTKPYEYELPQAYVAVVSHGSIIGGSGVVLTNKGYLLHDSLAKPDDDNINITDNGLFMLFGEPHKLWGKYITCHKRHRVISIDSGISLVWNMSSNYYHFTMEAVAKMYFVEKASIDKTIPLIVDQRVLNVPQMKEVLDALNTDCRTIIPVDCGILCTVNNLYCIGPVNKVLCNRNYGKQYSPKVEDFAYDPSFVSYYKMKVQAYSDKNTSSLGIVPEKVYLTRRNCRDRKCNEEDVLPVLEQYGFQVMQTEKMSLSDQYKLFSAAKHIIGTSGAAFTNMVFGDLCTRYLIFVSFRGRNTCYSNLAASIGSKCDFIAGESLYDDTKRVNEHREFYYLNPNVLKDYLSNIYDESKD